MLIFMWVLVYLFVGFWVTQLYLVPAIEAEDVGASYCLVCQFFWPMAVIVIFTNVTWPEHLQKSVFKTFGKIGDQIVALYTICSKSFDK